MPLITIIALSLSLSYIIKKPFEFILPLATAGISSILYIFALIGFRSVGLYTILLLTVVSLFYVAYKSLRDHNQLTRVLRSSGLIYILIMAALFYVISYGFTFMAWDEFSHWGLILKNIFLTNNFGNLASSTTYFQSYPPGISLFLNFFTHFSSYFNESDALRGMLILSSSQLVILFLKISFRDYKKIALLSLILFIFPLIFFGSFYSTIYVDAIMGLIFGNILYFNYVYRKKDLFYATYMSLQFYLLVSAKQIGIGLALIAFIIMLSDLIFSNKTTYLRISRKIFNKELLYVFVPLFAGILTNLSWKIYLKFHNITEQFQVPAVSNIFSNIPPYRKTTTVNFIHYFFDLRQFGILNYSYLLWSVTLFLVLYLVYKIAKNEQKTFVPQLFVWLGLYCYCCMILFMYLFSFGAYEAQNLASIDRYFGSYYLGFLMFSIFVLLSFLVTSNRYKKLSNFTLSALVVLLFSIAPAASLVNDVLLSPVSNHDKQKQRAPYEDIKRYNNILNPKTDKVYIVAQNTSGFDYWVLRYNLTPVKASPVSTWSLGEPYSKADIWTIKKTPIEWSRDLANYTYVYLYDVDSRFINDYGRLFKDQLGIKNTSMYRVIHANSGIILERVNL